METRAKSLDPFAQWWMDSLGSGLIAVDADARIVLLNGEAKRILVAQHPDSAKRYDSPLRGQPGRRVLCDQPQLWRRLSEALSGAEGPGRVELALESAAGEGATIGFSPTTIRDPDGVIRGAAVQFRDLTPFERRAARERLRERLVALGETAAGLAHEIRNPLAAMEITAGLLKRRLLDDAEAVSLVEDLRGEVAHVAAVVDQSLDFVRPSPHNPERVDAIALLEEGIRVARARTGYRGAVVRDLPADPPPLHADVEGLRGVITNLLLNAFEALEGRNAAAQRVEVTLETLSRAEENGVADEVVLRVSDNGPGIESVRRERVFYPFFTSKQAGSGVGLAMAQKVVAEHGGRIELESEEGAGATFRVYLPSRAETTL